MNDIKIKTESEIKKMEVSGRLAAEVLELVDTMIKPGVKTSEINDACHNHIVDKQLAIPAPLDYKGFPKSICTSVNHVICHGIPNENQILKEGDIINVDVTVIKDGYHGDSSKMYIVGKKYAKTVEDICEVAQESMYAAIKLVKPGNTFGLLGKAIQTYAEKRGYFIVRDFCGHGIGIGFHEDPQVLHYADKENKFYDTVLEKGMVFTIEPMINESLNPKEVIYSKVLNDGWTAVTADKKFEKIRKRKALSAQWEHTILVTENGCKVLTIRKEEKDFANSLKS
jgi:methionyl aminopeptidase